MADNSTKKTVEVAPDPDEDELDELDDVLDEFAATKIDPDTTTARPTASGPGRPSASAPPPTGPADDDDFAKQLQAGMADLLSELDKDPNMQKQFEDLVKELGNAAANDDGIPDEVAAATRSAAKHPAEALESLNEALESGATSKPTAAKAEQSFQDTIKKAMDRMQESSSSADAAAQSQSEEDMLAQMLREMEKGGFGEGAGAGSEEDFSKMLMGMMEQLTNKDILFEPMKELNDKFPAWMDQNKDRLQKEAPEDLKRYQEQQRLVTEITKKFEESNYSDQSAAHREYIVERMQKMQAAGSPPPDLVGDMNAAQEALNEIDSGCPQQ